jgi:negative regulator of PHO system
MSSPPKPRPRPRRSSPAAAESKAPSTSTSSPSTPPPILRCPKYSTCYSTAPLPASVDSRLFLDTVCSPSSLLWDSRYTSKQRPSFTPPLRTSSSPAVRRTPVIIRDDLETEVNIDEMDKRHPSSFQQLEKLGEGTYATVC